MVVVVVVVVGRWVLDADGEGLYNTLGARRACRWR